MTVNDEVPERPATAPSPLRDTRAELAAEFLHGAGLEIGALHLAMPIPPGATVRYVDRMPVKDLRLHYSELSDWDLAPVDVVDDGERLVTIEPESVDFIVANHFLEHCEDPIRTLQTHLGKLRPGGILFYAVPDKRYTFDFRRPRTPLQHVIADYENGSELSRSQHYLEWVQLVDAPPTGRSLTERAAELEAEGYSIHFHVWTLADLVALILEIQRRLDNFDVEAVRRRGIENIVVLRKRGRLVAQIAHPSGPESTSRIPDPAPPVPRLSPEATRARIPLAALRARLDDGALQAHWSIDPDGTVGRGLVQSAPSSFSVPLTLTAPVRFEARVRLLPHDWRDGTRAVRASVIAASPSGDRAELWSASVRSADAGGLVDGLIVDCEVPATTTMLILRLEPPAIRDPGSAARGVWMDPAITDPNAPADRGVGPSTPPPATPLSRDRPLISVLTPVHDPPLAMLHEAIDSVLAQTFTDWQLCLIDDGSRDPDVSHALRRYAEVDPRIQLHRREHAGGISDATNAALNAATGHYIALLDHDDWLGPEALAQIAARIAADPTLDMLYTDEDIVLDGAPIWVHLKPGWSPDTLRTNGYTCHLGVYRRSLVQEIGGFRSEFNGSQDIDMILRLIECTDRISHVPGVHYHWRIHPDSTAGGDAKPYAYVAARDAIAAHLEREGVDAEVQYGPPGLYRVVHHVPETSSAALVLALEDDVGLEEAAASWPSQTHRNWRIVVCAAPEVLSGAMAKLRAAGISNHRIVGVFAQERHDRHAALAAAAMATDAEQLILMQSPVAGLTQDWLTRLIGYAGQPGIAAAGPLLLAPNGQISDAGIAFPEGRPIPLLHGGRSSMDDHFGYGTSVYNVSAVSGMLATSRSIYERLGGLRSDLAELSLVDYCVRARELGLRIVTVPDARLQVTGHDRTMNDLPRINGLRRDLGEALRTDDYYNPGFCVDRGDFSPRRPR